MTRQYLTVLGVMLVSASAGSAAQIPLRVGQYEVIADMDFAGTKLSQKNTDCITADQLKDFSTAVMDADEQQSCKVSNYKVSGNKVTFNTTCEEEGLTMTSMTFATESFTGAITSKDNQSRTTTIRTTAKRVGECKG
jgi:hypothetical protein